LIHSDQGAQFGSDAWQRFCRRNHLEPSISPKGNCWDNAVTESFFSLKKERIKTPIYRNRELAIADVAEYIDTSTIGRDVTATSEASVSSNSKRPIKRVGSVSTRSWELHV
jgi:putative transposase